MDATSIIALLAFGLSFATFIVLRLNREPPDDLSDKLAHGDVPHIPMAARTGGKGASRVTIDSEAIARSHNGSVTP